jgi:chaperonin GroES
MKMSTVTNTSGITPVGYRVLVKPDPIERTTSGGIVLPETAAEAHDRAQQTGILIALGPEAWKDYSACWASVGDRVMFARYGGVHLTGKDGVLYRMLNDEQITAVIEDGVSLSDLQLRKQYGT